MLTLLAAAAPLFLAPGLAAATPHQPSSAQDQLALLRTHAPESTLIWFETAAAEPILREGLDHPLVARVLNNPLVAGELKDRGQAPAAAVAALEALLGQSPFELGHAVASGGIAFGMTDLTPGREAIFAVLRGQDADEMEEALEEVFAVLEGLRILEVPDASTRRSLPSSVRRAYGSRDGSLAIAWLRSDTLVLASGWETLTASIDGSASPQPIEEAHSRAELGASTFAWLDLDAIEAQVGLGDLRAIPRDPGAQLILGPALTSLGRSRTLAFELDLQADRVQLRVSGEDADLGAGEALFPRSHGIDAAAALPEELDANAQLHRDLGAFFSQRTTLFPPRAQPELAEAESNLSLLVGGPDALEELLSAMHPLLTLEAETIVFPEDAKPDVPLPALTAALRLKDPKRNGNRLTSAFQSAVSLVNVEQAMAGREGLRLALMAVGATTVTTTSLSPPAKGMSVDLRHNFTPACALVGDTFLLGTRPEAVTEKVRASAQGAAPTITHALKSASPGLAAPHPWIAVDRLSIRGSSLLSLLLRQRDLLVMQGVLEDGLTEARAAARADTLLDLIAQVVRLDYGSHWGPPAASTETNGAGLRTDVILHLAH